MARRGQPVTPAGRADGRTTAVRDRLDELAREYADLLRDHLLGTGEAALQRAYELGRRAIDQGLGTLDVAQVHQEAFVGVLRGHPRLHEEGAPIARAAADVLLEALAPIEMTRRGFEAQLLEAEKLVAMGSLLAAVAHELNNPLAVILGHATLLRDGDVSGPPTERVSRIAEAAERCALIVRNLLGLARRHPPGRQMVNPNEIVRGALQFLSYQLRVHGVEVALDLAADMPPIWADPHQLYQLVVNLCANADQAMRQTAPPRRLRVATRLQPGRIVVLEVADTGPGLSLELRRRIFEPFFTTRPVGEGTGLGLPICQRVVAWHGGAIRVASEPGQGATFAVELPIGTPAEGVPESPGHGSGDPVPGRRILVVDDEPAVAAVLRDILALDGHEVDVAMNGVAALAKLQERRYDLIVSDIRMPGLDGPGLYDALARQGSRLLRRLVFVTGDLMDPGLRTFVERTGVVCLHKPFTPDEVRRVTEDLLRSSED